MSRNKKPRKAYRPKGINPKACEIAMARFTVLRKPVDDNFAADFELAALTALNAVVRGCGTEDQWDVLAHCLNQSWLLCQGGLGPEAKDTLMNAQEAMKRMIPGFKAHGVVAFASGADLRMVEAALALWAEQIRMATIGEFTAATELVERNYWKPAHREAA